LSFACLLASLSALCSVSALCACRRDLPDPRLGPAAPRGRQEGAGPPAHEVRARPALPRLRAALRRGAAAVRRGERAARGLRALHVLLLLPHAVARGLQRRLRAVDRPDTPPRPRLNGPSLPASLAGVVDVSLIHYSPVQFWLAVLFMRDVMSLFPVNHSGEIALHIYLACLSTCHDYVMYVWLLCQSPLSICWCALLVQSVRQSDSQTVWQGCFIILQWGRNIIIL